MTEFERIFHESTAALRHGHAFRAMADMGLWHSVFKRMRLDLEIDGYTSDEQRTFMSAISAGIDAAEPDELSGPERIALRTALLAAFDGAARPLPETLIPKAYFLRHVRFLQ